MARRTPPPAVTHFAPGPDTLSALTTIVTSIRPDWDRGLVGVILRDLAPRVTGTDLVLASVRAAMNTDLPHPRAIAWQGKHWADLTTRPEHHRPRVRCGVCGRTEDQCYGSRPGVDDDHVFEPMT